MADNDLRVLLFQSVRGLIFNIVKPAGASKAHLSLHKDKDRLRIEVSDDGHGFDPEQAMAERSDYGLATMHRRLELFGGELRIHSNPKSGTRATIISPLDRPKG